MMTESARTSFISILEERFILNQHLHSGVSWNDVKAKLLNQPDKLEVLYQMDVSGGEPDVVFFKSKPISIFFCDCSKESPIGRRSLCYDEAAWHSRKENKPKASVELMCEQMKIELLTEQDYTELQTLASFDLKTSSWLSTPIAIRNKGGAIFGDNRFGRVFIYHNGAESYYAARGFRGKLEI